ncbi:MAG: hypothetical protein ACREIB_03645, partial [Pseudomonadota bacterium]
MMHGVWQAAVVPASMCCLFCGECCLDHFQTPLIVIVQDPRQVLARWRLRLHALGGPHHIH